MAGKRIFYSARRKYGSNPTSSDTSNRWPSSVRARRMLRSSRLMAWMGVAKMRLGLVPIRGLKTLRPSPGQVRIYARFGRHY